MRLSHSLPLRRRSFPLSVLFGLSLLVTLAAPAVRAQTDPPVPPDPTPPTPQGPNTPRVPGGGRRGGGAAAGGFQGVFPGGGGAAAAAKPRPYDEVITKAAKTQTGLFKTHQIE